MTTHAVRRIAVASAGLLALVAIVSCSSTKADVKSDAKKVSHSVHSAVVRAYDDSKSALDKAGDKIGDTSRSAYDKSKKDLESFGADLEDASSRVGDDAKRAYRSLKHRVDGFDHDVDRHLHRVGNDIGDDEVDAWSDVKDGYHHVSNSIDHAIDRLT